jgi:hypothetical protein
MPFPTLIAEEADPHYSFGFLAVTRDCQGAKYHSPKPLIVKNYVLDPEWGFQTVGDGEKYFGTLASAWMCGTCADNVALYLQLLKKHDGEAEWPVRREFGNLIRTLGDDAWQTYQRHKRAEERMISE